MATTTMVMPHNRMNFFIFYSSSPLAGNAGETFPNAEMADGVPYSVILSNDQRPSKKITQTNKGVFVKNFFLSANK